MFTLQYDLRIPPMLKPLVKQFQIDNVSLFVQEAGQLKLDESKHLDAWFRITDKNQPEGKALFAFWGSKGCETWTEICATLDGSQCRTGGDVYICPGDDVYLWWNSSTDVINASITPNVGQVNPHDHTKVNPTNTTDYEIMVSGPGQCTDSATQHVKVFNPGESLELIVPPKPQIESWQITIPLSHCSENIVITGIEPKCGAPCFIHNPPILNYLYMKCSNNTMCNGFWSGKKEDINGQLHFFETGLLLSKLSDIPLAGTWTFVPLVQIGANFTGNAYFTLYGKCKHS